MTRIIRKHLPLAERSFPRLMLAMLVAGALLMPASAHAKKTAEQKELLEWVGDGYDPERFDLDVVNKRLTRTR